MISMQQANLEPLPERQKLVAILLAVGLLLAVLEMVRRRKLREEYSVLWVVTACALLVLALEQDLILLASRWIGAATATSTLFFGGLVFLMLVALQFSVRVSKLTHRNKALGQKLALLEEELEKLRGGTGQEPEEGSEVPPSTQAHGEPPALRTSSLKSKDRKRRKGGAA